MADCTNPGTPQEPAGAAHATSPRGAETLSTPEISAPMLDVHAPHQTVHTWKDFWVHLATISIGLLIAIGLEQSVEAFHRLHERHRLEQDLQLEAKKNLILMDIDYQSFDLTRPWLIQLRTKAEEMRESTGKLKFVYPLAPKTKGLWWPDAPYWNTAKESAEVGLLPRDEAGMYDLVYTEQGAMKEKFYEYVKTIDAIRRFESRFANLSIDSAAPDSGKVVSEQPDRDIVVGIVQNDTPIPDVSRMTAEDLREYSVLLNDALTELSRFRGYTNLAYGVTRAVTLGAKSDEQLFQMMGGRADDKSSPEKPAAR